MPQEKLGLSTLEDISTLILQSHDLDQTLNNIVQLVANRMKTEVCSIYLTSAQDGSLRLRATVGLSQESVGQVSLKVGEGLVGYTAQNRAVVNVQEPQNHPRYRYFEGTQEENYHSFLGLPLFDRQQLIGVLALQTVEPRDFSALEISTLTTIAFQLSAIVVNARLLDSLHRQRETDVEISSLPEDAPGEQVPVLRGKVAYSGVAIGPAILLDEKLGFADIIEESNVDIDRELDELEGALGKTRIHTLFMERRVAERLSQADAAIFHSHLMILEDRGFLDKIEHQIRDGHTAAYALKRVVGEYIEAFRRMEDPYLRERAVDMEDIGRRILANLVGQERHALHLSRAGILVAKELMPSDMAMLDHDQILGLVLESGQSNSHAVIMAKSMGIPALIGVNQALRQLDPDLPLILDGNSGCLYIDPNEQVQEEYRRLEDDNRRAQEQLQEFHDKPALTADGERVFLRANVGLLSDVEIAQRNGAEGVGLYRTEFPYMARSSFPDRDDQYQLYKRVVESFAGQPVTIRTLDIGGDKALPYFNAPKEDNPFMGWRSVRVSLDHREMFRTQVEAILMAATHGPVKLLFPMICNMDEVHACKEVVAEAQTNLEQEGWNLPEVPLGVMIEVPAAIVLAHHMAPEVDFFALGTNDLIQYMLAADRANPMIHQYYEPLHPAVIMAIRQLVEVSKRYDKGLCICGEMASDPACFPLLVGLGLREFSVSAPAILRMKAMLSRLSLERLTRLGEEALQVDHNKKVRRLVDSVMQEINDSPINSASENRF